MDRQVIQSVEMTMRILECLAKDGDEKGVTEIAIELGETKPRIHRHLQTLRHLGYVKHNPATKKDYVGVRLHLLANRVGTNVKLSSAIRPIMEKLRDDTMQTVVFANVLDGQIRIIDYALGTTPVQFAFRVGASFNLNSTALGHISLAFGPKEYWNNVKSDKFVPETPKTNIDPNKLSTRVKIARDRGWTIVPEEAVMGVNAIAAPIFNHDATFAGSIAIVGSVNYIPDNPSDVLVQQVIAACHQASRNLGYRPD